MGDGILQWNERNLVRLIVYMYIYNMCIQQLQGTGSLHTYVFFYRNTLHSRIHYCFSVHPLERLPHSSATRILKCSTLAHPFDANIYKTLLYFSRTTVDTYIQKNCTHDLSRVAVISYPKQRLPALCSRFSHRLHCTWTTRRLSSRKEAARD